MINLNVQEILKNYNFNIIICNVGDNGPFPNSHIGEITNGNKQISTIMNEIIDLSIDKISDKEEANNYEFEYSSSVSFINKQIKLIETFDPNNYLYISSSDLEYDKVDEIIVNSICEIKEEHKDKFKELEKLQREAVSKSLVLNLYVSDRDLFRDKYEVNLPSGTYLWRKENELMYFIENDIFDFISFNELQEDMVIEIYPTMLIDGEKNVNRRN